MILDIWVEQTDRNLLTDLFEFQPSEYNKIVLDRQKKIVGEGITLQYRSQYSCDSVDIPTWIIIGVEIGKDIAIAILSSYLYDKLKERKSKLLINGKEAKIDEKEIEKMILLNYNPENERTFSEG